MNMGPYFSKAVALLILGGGLTIELHQRMMSGINVGNPKKSEVRAWELIHLYEDEE